MTLGDSLQGRARWTVAGPREECVSDAQVDYSAAYDDEAGLRLVAGPWRSGQMAGRILDGRVERHGPDRFRTDGRERATGNGVADWRGDRDSRGRSGGAKS